MGGDEVAKGVVTVLDPPCTLPPVVGGNPGGGPEGPGINRASSYLGGMTSGYCMEGDMLP